MLDTIYHMMLKLFCYHVLVWKSQDIAKYMQHYYSVILEC